MRSIPVPRTLARPLAKPDHGVERQWRRPGVGRVGKHGDNGPVQPFRLPPLIGVKVEAGGRGQPPVPAKPVEDEGLGQHHLT